MKAYVTRISIKNQELLGTGNQWITKDYKIERSLIVYGVLPHLKPGEAVLVEVFYNWDKRYGTPSITFYVNKTETSYQTHSGKIPLGDNLALYGGGNR